MEFITSGSQEYSASNQLDGDARARKWTLSALIGLTFLGLWFRLRNLGALGLIVDEGVQALAVRGILDSGLPLLNSGWVYSRGVLFSYLQAFFAIGPWGVTETTLRLPAVLFGTAAIPAVYWFARTVFDRWVGLLAATLLALSVWEIELSRYARFYTAFQFLYLLSLTCFYLGFIRKRKAYRIAFVAVTALAFTSHELAVMLLTSFAIPFLSPNTTRSEKKQLIFWGVGMAGLWFLQRRLTLLLESLHDAPAYIAPSYTSNLEEAKSMLRSQVNVLVRIHAPDTRYITDLFHQHSALAAAVGVGLLALCGWIIWRYARSARNATITAIVLIWAAAFHQLGLAVIFLATGLTLWANGWRWLWSPPLRIAYGVLVLAGIFWSAWILSTSSDIMYEFGQIFAGFPDFFGYYLQWFVVAWPIFLIVFLRGCFLLMDQFLHDRTNLTPIFVLGAIFIPVVLTSFLRWRYIEARYTFQYYPVMLTIFAFALVDIGRYLQTLKPYSSPTATAIGIGVFVAAIFLSQDANPAAAWSVSGRGYTDRRDAVKSVLNWEYYAHFHQDHQTPATYVSQNRKPADEILVFGPAHMAAVYTHYLGKVDYLLERYGKQEYIRQDADGALVSYISGSKVLSEPQELLEILAETREGSLWLLGDRMLLQPENHYYGEQVKEMMEQLAQDAVYIGEDGVTFVVKLK